MSINDIQAFIGRPSVNPSGRQEPLSPNAALNEQLQESGLQQAREFNENLESTLSSRYTLAYSALSESFQRNVRLNDESPERTSPPEEEISSTGFDFEEVANNVFNFVGRVIQNAARSGADNDQINLLFEQAQVGIDKGISSARQDLSSVIDEELSGGIDNVGESLAQRLTNLRQEIFSPVSETQTSQSQLSSFAGGELSIRTRDGDQVSLSFSQIQSTIINTSSSTTDSLSNQADQANTNSTQLTTYLDRLGVSLEVSGELDEGELQAITDLVDQISGVADQFFNGNIESAFEEALELGFNQEELSNFSAQFVSVQSVSAQSSSSVRAYEEVQNFEGTDTPKDNFDRRFVADYVNDLLSSIDRSSQLLGSVEDYSNIATSIINTFGDDVLVPDLISAVNRFNQFNENIINSVAQ